MKKIIALTLAFAIAGFSLSAQQTRESKSQKKAHGMQHGKKDMVKDLNLTDAQKAQLQADREANKAKMEALKKQDNLTVKEMRERKAALLQEQKASRDAILTAEQKAVLAAEKADMAGKRKNMDGQRGEYMKEKMGLSNDQAAQLKAHNEATHAQIKAIQENQTLSTEQKKAQIKTVKETANTQRKSILTTEQIKRMDEMKKEGKPGKGRKAVK
jgi:periplasmic protein CpxP/Spy